MQIPILGSLGSNIFGPNHNMLQFGESSFDPNDIDGLIQYLFKPGTSQPYEDPAVPNRWLVPDNRPGTGTGLAVDGAAVKPDGINDNVIVTGIATTGTSWSFSGWFKSSSPAEKYLFDQVSPRVVINWRRNTKLAVYTDAGPFMEFGSTPNDGAWHYITFVLDGTAARCFVDGVQSGTDVVISSSALNVSQAQRLFSRYTGDNYFWQGTASQIRIDDIALTLAQHTAAMSGDPTDPDYPPNATCLRYWSCEDYHNTLLLDSSGNGGHGTKGGITTGRGSGTFHYQGSNVPLDSLVARRGYTLDGTHGVIPARLTGSLDALGSSLQYTGPLKRPGQAINSSCLLLDGVDDYASASVSIALLSASSGRLRVQCTFVGSSVSNERVLEIGNVSRRVGIYRDNTDTLKCYITNSGGTKTESTGLVPATDGTIYDIDLIYTATELTVNINGSPVVNVAGNHSVSFIGVPAVAVGAFVGDIPNNLYRHSGKILGVEIWNGGDLVGRYTCSEGAGISLHNSEGTLPTLTLNGVTLPTVWSTANGKPHNLIYGYSLHEHDTLPPLRIGYVDGSPHPSPTIPTGYTLTRHNPAGAKHNGCKTLVDCTAGIASPGSANLETAWSFNTARTNPRFKRNLTSSGSPVAVDKMYAYLSALSGSDLTNVQTDTADTSA